jgi:hypothetical protein
MENAAADGRKLSDLSAGELRTKAQERGFVRFSRRNGDRRQNEEPVKVCRREDNSTRRLQKKAKTGMCLEFRPGTECMTIIVSGEPDWPIPIRHLREFV